MINPLALVLIAGAISLAIVIEILVGIQKRQLKKEMMASLDEADAALKKKNNVEESKS